MKPSYSIVPIALMCGLLSTGGAAANPQEGLRLAQGTPPQANDKNEGDNKDDKGKKDRGKDQDKGDHGGKGPGRPDRGPRERKGEPPPQKPQQPQREEKKAPPPKQFEQKPVMPKIEKPAPKPTPPPKKVDPRERQREKWEQRSRGNAPETNSKPTLTPQVQPQKVDPRAKEREKWEQRSRGNTPAQESKPVPPPQGPPKDAGRQDNDWKNGNRGDNNSKGGDRKDNGGSGDNRKNWDRRDADKGGPGRPERGRWSGGKRPDPTEARDIKDLITKRKERSEDGGKRVIIEEPDKRRIIREGGRTIIRHDENERFRRISRDTRTEKRNGLDISVMLLPGGIQIFTDLDNEGRTLRRYRRGPDGRDIVLFDNRDYYRRSRGGSFLDAIIDLPPPRLRIPRERYIVEYEGASDDDIYDTLDAGPVDDLDRGYSLEEVRRSPMLRDRMRRIDLDTVNFEFGSWTVDDSQYGALERVARAMNRIIDRNPGEMFLIEGHTDAVGSDDDNLSLSDRRAESVAIILTEEFGVPPENLTTQGYGEQYLKVPTDGPERLNRRVAVRKITPLLAR